MEKDIQKIKEAKACGDCLCWHKHCKAECCKVFYINDDAQQFGNSSDYMYIKRNPRITLGYYLLRGFKLVHGRLRIEKKYCIKEEGRFVYKQKCGWLTDELLCEGHPDKKPEICRRLTLENARNKDITLTPNCLYSLKQLV